MEEVSGNGRGDIHGDGELGARLAEPAARKALERQGVHASELLACTARGTGSDTRARAATVLAQTLWDAELHSQRPRPVLRPTSAPGPRRPTSRPPESARDARYYGLALHMEGVDKLLVSRRQADQAAEDSRTARCLEHVEMLGHINRAKIAQTDAWKVSEAQRLAELKRLSAERNAAHTERTYQQNSFEHDAHQDRMAYLNEERVNVVEARRNELVLAGRAVERVRTKRCESAHAGARARRQDAIESKRCGPPQMRFKEHATMREWQGTRLDRLRRREQRDLQQRLDQPPADPPFLHH